uniref:Prohibitin n=1 Tax=Eimeria tenella TaxID=5802 RepID=H9B9A1_EIMTE|nr:hypothetical protein [Eimeria tenella]
MTERVLTNLGRLGVAVGVSGLFAKSCLYDVDGGQRCIMFNRFGGVSPRPVGEGLHMFVPWLQVPYIYDIRTQPKVITTTTGTRDLQMVSLSLRLLYRPNEARLPVLHQTLARSLQNAFCLQ